MQKCLWHVAKQFLKVNKSSSYPPLQHNNTLISDNAEKVNAFNKFVLSHSNVDNSNASLPECELNDNNNVRLTEIEVSEHILSEF